MIIDYINYFKSKFPQFLDYDDLKLDYSDDYAYQNKDADVVFIAQQIRGDYDTSKIAIYPVQLLIYCDERFEREIRDALDNFGANYHRKVDTISEHKLRQLYSTSYSLNNVVQIGIRKFREIAMNVSLVSFAGLDIEEFKLNDQLIDFQSFSFSYAATPLSVGSVPKNVGLIKTRISNVALTWTIQFIPNNTTVEKALFKQLATKNGSANTHYVAKFKAYGETFQMDAVLSSGGNAKDVGAIPIITISLVTGDFDA